MPDGAISCRDLSGAKVFAEQNSGPDHTLQTHEGQLVSNGTRWHGRLQMLFTKLFIPKQIYLGSRIPLVAEMCVTWFHLGGRERGGREEERHELDVYLVVWARTQGQPELLTPVTWVWRAVANNQCFHSKALNHFIRNNKHVWLLQFILQQQCHIYQRQELFICKPWVYGHQTFLRKSLYNLPLRRAAWNFKSPRGRFLWTVSVPRTLHHPTGKCGAV